MAVLHPRSRLDSFVEGALTPYSRARVSAHLADCADCRREVGQRERILRAASSLGPVPGAVSIPLRAQFATWLGWLALTVATNVLVPSLEKVGEANTVGLSAHRTEVTA